VGHNKTKNPLPDLGEGAATLLNSKIMFYS